MPRPFCLRSRHAAGALRHNDRLLKIGGVPRSDRTRHGLTILCYAEHAECRRAMIGKIAVEIGPAPVAGRIEAHEGSAGELEGTGRCATLPWPGEDRLSLADAARSEPATVPWPRARLQREWPHRPRRCGTA